MPKFKNIRIKKPGGGFRMQRAQVLKSGKLKFVKNKPRGGGRKTAAKKTRRAPRRAVARKPTRRRRSVAKKSNPGNRAPKMGAVLKGARAADTISGPAQGVLQTGGGPRELVARYDNKAALKESVSGAAVGLLRNVITSKSGAYRGISQNKILSYVQAFSSEIVAAGRANPIANPSAFNDHRHAAHEGYVPSSHSFAPSTPQLRESAVLQAGAWVAQKVAQKLGINKMLPKGVNF